MKNKTSNLKLPSILVVFVAFSFLASCATLTGIPGHGGGKRFTEEQRLVSSSIRLAVKQLDVSALRGRRVALVFGLIADEGGGNIVGGRASITALLMQGQVTVPTSSSQNSVDIFQVANSSSSFSYGTGSNTSSSNSTTSGTGGSSSQTDSSQNSETTSEFSTDANQTTDTTGESSTDTTSSNESSTDSSSSSSTETNETTNNTGSSGQAIVTGTRTSASGEQSEQNIGITYEGLGQFQNLAVPKSDASYLMSQVRNHLLLNGIDVRSPEDPSADAFAYVSVDVLGTNRQRTDLLVYNQESLRAETHIEIFAIDRAGWVILYPEIGNVQTYYKEDYIAWSGPYNLRRGAEQGIGLINDIEGVSYGPPVEELFLGVK